LVNVFLAEALDWRLFWVAVAGLDPDFSSFFEGVLWLSELVLLVAEAEFLRFSRLFLLLPALYWFSFSFD